MTDFLPAGEALRAAIERGRLWVEGPVLYSGPSIAGRAPLPFSLRLRHLGQGSYLEPVSFEGCAGRMCSDVGACEGRRGPEPGRRHYVAGRREVAAPGHRQESPQPSTGPPIPA